MPGSYIRRKRRRAFCLLRRGARAGVIGQLLLETTREQESVDPLQEALSQSFQQASGLLDSWDAYVNALSVAGAEGGLKAAYPLLENMEQQVWNLKQGAQPLAGKHVVLESLINELEVLTVAEKFKFNRGDYLQ